MQGIFQIMDASDRVVRLRIVTHRFLHRHANALAIGAIADVLHKSGAVVMEIELVARPHSAHECHRTSWI